jgi:hypothetical protein
VPVDLGESGELLAGVVTVIAGIISDKSAYMPALFFCSA